MRFSKSEIKTIFSYIKTIKEFDSSDISSKHSRRYTYRIIERNTETQWIFDVIEKYFSEKSNIKIVKQLDCLYVHKYKTGDFFIRHVDTDYAIHNVGICLNDDYEGGDFIVYNPTETLPKVEGSIYDFNSRREHEITKITKGTRWSIIGFFQRENLILETKKSLL
jgi:PKHD-type hydroxylase